MLVNLFEAAARCIDISFILWIVSIAVSTVIISCAPDRHPVWQRAAFAAAAAAVVSLAFISVNYLSWNENFDAVWLGIQMLLVTLSLLLLNHFRTRTRLQLFFSQMTCMAAVQQLVNYASRMVSIFEGPDVVHWLLRSLAGLLLIPCALLIRRWNTDRYERIPGSAIVLSAMLMGAVFWVDAWTTVSDEYVDMMESRSTLMILFSVLLTILLCSLVFSYLIHHFCELQDQVSELQVSVRDRKRIEELMAVSEETSGRMREVRHDIKNQFTYVSALADKGDVGEVQRYLHELSYDFLKPLKSIDCGNRAMNAILNMELSKAEKQGIDLDAQVIIPPELPFSESDLCSLVANAIDNALEGWVRTDGNAGVNVRMVMQGDELLLSVTNPTDKDSGFLQDMHTTKEDRDAHGYGSRIIRRIIDKYHGYSSYEIEGGQFCFSCVLNREEET